MSETLRDLVVSLSLQTDNFTRNIKSVNKQIQEAESFFKLAATGVENFEHTAQGLSAHLSTLQQRLSLQREVVDQYGKALDAARSKLSECYARQGEYAQRLTDAQQNQAALNAQLISAREAYEDCKNRLGETDQATMAASAHLEDIKNRYAAATAEVTKLSGQCEALKRATQNAADAVSQGNVNLNKASAAVKQTEADIQSTNRELQLAQTQWQAAGEAIRVSENAVASIGKQMQSAEASFRLATVGIRDVDSSATGLSERLTLLQSNLQNQNRIVQEYENILRSAREQLAAAQQVNDPDKIRQATDAITDAETALKGAQTAVKLTEQAITECNAQLQLANNGWFSAAESIRASETAIASIGNQMKLAESQFTLATAGMKDTDTSVAGLTARLSLLQDRLTLQTQAVREYGNILAQAQTQLAAAQAAGDPEKVQQATDAVTRAQTALNSANAVIKTTQTEIAECNAALQLANTNWYTAGETIQRSQAAIASIGKEIQQTESEFRLASVGIQNLDQSAAGLSAKLDMLADKWMLQREAVSQAETALQAAQEQLAAAQAVNDPDKIRQASDAVTEAQTALNDARTALAQTEQEIANTNQALSLAETDWYAAGRAIDESKAATTSLGKQMQIAENDFRAATAGIKDVDTSVTGLTQKIAMLQSKLTLQQEAVQHYEDALAAARVQLEAAQDANDPDRIREAANAVEDAEVSLSRARAEVAQTRAELGQTNTQLRTASSMWTSLGAACEGAGKRLEAAGKNATRIGRVLTTGISAPVAALGVTAMKASIDFESSFTSVRKTVEATEAEFADLAAASKQMSTQVAASTDEINEVMATGGQLGIANEHLQEFTRVMIDLGNCCEDLNADDAATSIAKFANVMGTNQGLFQNIGSTIVDLGNNFATTERPIMEMAQRLAGAGKQVGLTEAQVLGFAAALSSVGIQAQMGGSAFSKALINMEVACATGGDSLNDFGKVCGMTAEQFKVLFESDPAAAFQAFIVGLAQMDEEGESAIAVLNDIGIKEIRLRDTMLRAVNATELFSNAQARANQAWEENTALQVEANKRYATTESKLINLKNKAALFAQTLGSDVSPMISQLISGVDSLLDRFMGLDESQRQQVIKWAAVAASVGPAILVYGKVSNALGTFVTGIGKFATAVGKAGGGFSGFLSVLGKSPSVWLAVAAATVVGVAALADYVSGAKAAREALKGMEETAKSWKETAAETFYNQSKGLSFFGMSAEDFQRDQQTAQQWVDGLIAVWTDGQKESDELVKTWTDSFKALTASTRTELQELQATADQAGYTGVSAKIQADIDSLDAMDQEIEKLLRKRQNGFLTDREKIRLQELIDTREAIEVKYHLSPADTDGFDTIVQKVEAEIARAQARGQTDAAVQVYEEALVACAEGMAAVNAQIDAQYDKEYAIVQMIEDEGERKTAQAALDQKYRENRLEGAREYAAAMAAVVMPVWEQDNIQQAATDVATLTQKLREYSALDMEGKKGMLGELNELTAAMDEDSLVEYIGLLTQIQSLLDSGMSESEVQSMFPDIDFSGALAQLASIQQYLKDNKWDVNLGSIQDMFGDALPDEMITLSTDLDMTGAQARWDGFAANPGAITTEAIIAGIQDDEAAERQHVLVDAVIEKYTEKPEGADKSTLSTEGLIAYVATYAEVTNGADVSALNPQNVTAMVAAYEELASGADVSTLKPDQIVAYIAQYLEKEGVDTTGLTPDGLTAFVLAYEEVNGGASTAALTPDDITATIARYMQAEHVDISKLSAPQIDALVTSFAEATNCDKSQLLTSFTAYVTEYKTAAGVSLPTIQMQVGLTGYDTIAYRKFLAQNPVEVNGIVKLGEIYDNPAEALKDDGAKFYDKNGIEIPVTAVPQEALTANTVAALDEDGTLHVLITPEITGTQEAVATMRTVVDEVDQLGVTMAGRAIGLVPTTLMGYVDAALKRIENYKNPGFLDFAWLTDLINASARLETLDFSMQSDFDAENVAELSTYVAEVVKAIQNGEQVSEDDINNLQSILTLISELDTLGVGENVTQGIAQGMTEAGWDTDAETVVSNLETAINTALDAHSPAQRMVPIGDNVAAGIGQGATEHDFSADAEAIAAAAQTAIEAAFAGGDEGSPAQAVGETLAAGIGQGAAAHDFAADASAMAASLTAALDTALAGESGAGSQANGTQVAESIGTGMAGYDFTTAADALTAHVMASVAAAMPPNTLTEYGQATMGGLANTLSGYSFSATGRTIGSNISSAVSSNLTSSTLRSIGVNAMAGLKAGINAGKSGVVSAMRSAAQAAVSAAKSALKIKSPSGVFRDEVGIMAMRGFGEGALLESKAQAKTLRNAMRYLTDAAQEGSIAAGSNDNRRTYNQTSNVNLNVANMSIRDEQDIRSLAVEIASLTRRQQRGRGLKMA